MLRELRLERLPLTLLSTVAFCLHVCLAVQSASAQDKFEWTGGKWVKLPTPAGQEPKEKPSVLRQNFEAGQYKKVIKAAKTLLKKHPADQACQEAYFLAGQAEIKRDRHYQAYEWFERQLDQFPSGKYSERALQFEYDIAEAFLRGQKRTFMGILKIKAYDEGLEILQRIAQHAPGTVIAANALLRVGDWHFGRQEWFQAVESYDTFLQFFPKSRMSGQAMGRAALATWSSYEGLAFDDTPLLEADQRFRILYESYPVEAEKIGAKKILRQIATIRAQKLLATAMFYQRTSRPGAASFYYRKMIELYPGTQWAKDAELSLELLGNVKPRRQDRTILPKPTLSPTRPDVPRGTAPAGGLGSEKPKGS